MAIDTLARGLAASNSGGGGGGSLDVGIEEGVGIKITGTDPKTISNDGVTNITASDSSANDGTIKVVFGNKEGEAASKHIAVKGLSDGAFMQKETSIPATASATDTKLPTSKAVASALDSKIDNSKKGVANGVATLDANAKLTSSQLPDHNHASNKINAMTGYTKPGTTSEITTSDTLNSAIGKLEKALDGKQASGTYATGDSNGNAVTANKLANAAAIGSVTKGVYFKADGTPATMTYELNATVPSDAKFTDTTYTADLNTGVTVNNTTYKISNTGVRGFIDSKESDGNGTFRANVGGTEKVIGIKGLSDAAYKGVQTTMTSTSTDLPTSQAIAKYVSDRISEIPDPMIFKGSVGTGGTVTTLPTPSSSGDTKNVGWTYKVITDGVVTGAKVGDTVISDGSNWVIIPSGDEPNGTVTSVGVSVPTGLKVANSPVTTSGTIAVSLDTGYEIPTSSSIVKKVNNITPTNNNVTLAGDNIATKSSTYSKATAEADITKNTKVDSAIGQLDYRTGKNKSDISIIKGYINNGDSESKNGTTCTINVPENVSDFASIAMIGGKTEKTKNILNHTCTTGSKVVSGVTISWVVNDDKSISISTSAAVPEAVSIPILGAWESTNEVFPNDTYTVIWANPTEDTGEISSKVQIKVVNNTTVICNDTTSLNKVNTFTGAPTYIYIRLSSGSTYSNYTVYPMIVKGTETKVLDYELYFDGLHSAQVESAVSLRKNLWDGMHLAMYPSTNGTWTATSTGASRSIVFPVEPNKQYFIKKIDEIGNRFRIATYSTIPKSGSACNQYIAPGNNTIEYTLTTIDGDYYVGLYVDEENSLEPEMYVGEIPYKTIVSVPDAIKNLPDYGIGISDTCYNYIDFETGKYYRNCKKVKVKDLTWTKSTNSSYTKNSYQSEEINDRVIGTRNTLILMAKYECKYNGESFDANWDKVVYGAGASPSKRIIITDDSITTLDDFKSTNSDEDIVYILANPEVIDLTSFLSPIECESGGTITFVNEHSLDVPNKVIYKKEV